jgi:hypothetical protein
MGEQYGGAASSANLNVLPAPTQLACCLNVLPPLSQRPQRDAAPQPVASNTRSFVFFCIKQCRIVCSPAA